MTRWLPHIHARSQKALLKNNKNLLFSFMRIASFLDSYQSTSCRCHYWSKRSKIGSKLLCIKYKSKTQFSFIHWVTGSHGGLFTTPIVGDQPVYSELSWFDTYECPSSQTETSSASLQLGGFLVVIGNIRLQNAVNSYRVSHPKLCSTPLRSSSQRSKWKSLSEMREHEITCRAKISLKNGVAILVILHAW